MYKDWIKWMKWMERGKPKVLAQGAEEEEKDMCWKSTLT